MKKTPNQKHKLSGIPTVYEETHKIIDSKTFDQVNIDKMEYNRNKRHEKAIQNHKALGFEMSTQSYSFDLSMKNNN